jgi:hypothetical protein
LTTYKELKKEISLVEENLEDISFGVYKPHFSFQTFAEYKTALENLRSSPSEGATRGQRKSEEAKTWMHCT